MLRREAPQGWAPCDVSDEMLAAVIGRKDASWRAETTVRMTDVYPLSDLVYTMGLGDCVTIYVEYTEDEVSRLFHHEIHGECSEMKLPLLEANLEQVAKDLWPTGSLEHFSMRHVGKWMLCRYATGVRTLPSTWPCCLPFTSWKKTRIFRIGPEIVPKRKGKEEPILSAKNAKSGLSLPSTDAANSSSSSSAKDPVQTTPAQPNDSTGEPSQHATSKECQPGAASTSRTDSTTVPGNTMPPGVVRQMKRGTRRNLLPKDFKESEVLDWIAAMDETSRCPDADPFLPILHTMRVMAAEMRDSFTSMRAAMEPNPNVPITKTSVKSATDDHANGAGMANPGISTQPLMVSATNGDASGSVPRTMSQGSHPDMSREEGEPPSAFLYQSHATSSTMKPTAPVGKNDVAPGPGSGALEASLTEESDGRGPPSLCLPDSSEGTESSSDEQPSNPPRWKQSGRRATGVDEESTYVGTDDFASYAPPPRDDRTKPCGRKGGPVWRVKESVWVSSSPTPQQTILVPALPVAEPCESLSQSSSPSSASLLSPSPVGPPQSLTPLKQLAAGLKMSLEKVEPTSGLAPQAIPGPFSPEPPHAGRMTQCSQKPLSSRGSLNEPASSSTQPPRADLPPWKPPTQEVSAGPLLDSTTTRLLQQSLDQRAMRESLMEDTWLLRRSDMKVETMKDDQLWELMEQMNEDSSSEEDGPIGIPSRVPHAFEESRRLRVTTPPVIGQMPGSQRPFQEPVNGYSTPTEFDVLDLLRGMAASGARLAVRVGAQALRIAATGAHSRARAMLFPYVTAEDEDVGVLPRQDERPPLVGPHFQRVRKHDPRTPADKMRKTRRAALRSWTSSMTPEVSAILSSKATRIMTTMEMSSSGSDDVTWSRRRIAWAGRRLSLLTAQRRLMMDRELTASGHSLLAELATRPTHVPIRFPPAGEGPLSMIKAMSAAVMSIPSYIRTCLPSSLTELTIKETEVVSHAYSFCRTKFTSGIMARGARHMTAQDEKMASLGLTLGGPQRIPRTSPGPTPGQTSPPGAVTKSEPVKAAPGAAAAPRAGGGEASYTSKTGAPKADAAPCQGQDGLPEAVDTRSVAEILRDAKDAKILAALKADSTHGSSLAESKIVPQAPTEHGGRGQLASTLLATMFQHGRTVPIVIDGITFTGVVGTEFDKKLSMDDTCIVGCQVGPMPVLPNVYANTPTNTSSAIHQRYTLKAKPNKWNDDDVKKVNAYVIASMAEGKNGVFSKRRIQAWVESRFHFELCKSPKWSDDRLSQAVEKCCRTVDPYYKHSTKVKLEQMPEGKAPRFLIIDGDEGIIMALLTICCFEDLLFDHFDLKSIKHLGRHDAIIRCVRELKPPVDKGDDWGSVEGDGSAWDTTCNAVVRGKIENPILWKIAECFKGKGLAPQSWHAAHVNSCSTAELKLTFFKKGFEKMVEVIGAIRRSGHRGTSCLNWWINYTMWVCSVFKDPTAFLCNKVRKGVDVNGVMRWWNGCMEGDDSLCTTSPKFKPPTVNGAVVTLHEHVQTIVDFWERAGFNMVFVFVENRATFCGTHIACNDGRLTGLVCPELPRALANAVCTSPSAIETLRWARPKTSDSLLSLAAAKAMSRAADFAGILPTVSMKYLTYALSIRAASDDFYDRELSFHSGTEIALQGTAVSYASVADFVMQANSLVTPDVEANRLEALGYGLANRSELDMFMTYPWSLDTLGDYDGYRHSLPASWRK